MKWPLTSLNAVFAVQTTRLLTCGYHNALKLSVDEFQKLLQPLRNQLSRITDIDIPKDYLPFLIVITNSCLPTEKQMKLLNNLNWNEECIINCLSNEVTPNTPIPSAPFYLAVDIEKGTNTKFQYPPMGAVTITIPDRKCLTIDEGLSLLAQEPDLVSFHSSLLLSGSCFTDQYHKGEIPFINLYTGEFDYGLELGFTLHQVPFCVSNEERKKWWGTPSCQFRISANDIAQS